jgi:hypothetical protein
MSEEVHESIRENYPTAFRSSAATKRQINDLMRLWHENQSQALIRCIERVWMMEVGIHQERQQTP